MNKPSLRAALQEQATPGQHTEALEDMLRLGRRLARGEIDGVRCAITGHYRRGCAGVRCFGSEPWGERDGGAVGECNRGESCFRCLAAANSLRREMVL